MKKILFGLLILLSNLGFAQEWQYDFDKAKKTATAEDKPIIVVFSGSDWCAPCIKLDRNVWQSEAFKKEASNWVLVKADFPRKKANELSKEQTEHNRKLADKYNLEGSFPLVVIMDNNGKVIAKMGFKNVSAEEDIKMIYTQIEK